MAKLTSLRTGILANADGADAVDDADAAVIDDAAVEFAMKGIGEGLSEAFADLSAAGDADLAAAAAALEAAALKVAALEAAPLEAAALAAAGDLGS